MAGTERTVLITGASTGIGEACALRLDRAGWRVLAGVRKDTDGERLRSQGSERLSPVRIDVADEGSIASARDAVASMLGARGLDGLVNNAGIAVAGPLEFLPIDELRRQLEVNVIGQIAVTQAFLPAIRKSRGRIVNMGSIGGRMATAILGPYNASKFAMEGLTDALRQELRPWGINVAIIEPGSIATPIWDKSQALADTLEERLPREGHALYDGIIKAVREFAVETGRRGVPPDRVAKAVEHALTSKRPKTRYLVGFDARMQALLKSIAPDRVLDSLVSRQLKLPKDAPQNVETPAVEREEVGAGERR
ncbi:MAG TPA: SDR family oxidoreductase [Dehalococcoidia bacterium]